MIKDALLISLQVSLSALVISVVVGVMLAKFFIKHKFKGQEILETIIMLPIFLPPSIVGYLLFIFIGKNGIIGAPLLKYYDINLIFTTKAAVIAAFVVSAPIMYQSAKGAFLSIDPIYDESARVMGASEFQILIKITIPLALKNILNGAILAFGRAFGEFGATLMVAGNIPGKTQTVPMAVYYAVESGDKSSANILLIIVLIISFSMIYILNFVLKNNDTY